MTKQLTTKEVNFNGDNLIAIQNDKGIYTVVSYVCNGLGLTGGQARRQVENISKDLVLNQGVANLRILTNGGKQTVLCILIDFLPLWLAKISITPNMKKTNPELVTKLIEYQLKAKDVLAQAFIPQLQQQPTFEYHMIECVKSINDNVNKIESDLNQFKQEVKTELQTIKQPKQLPQAQPKLQQPQKPQGDYYATLYNNLRYSTAKDFYNLVNKCFEKIAKARNTSISDTEQYIYDFLYANRKNWNSMGKGLSLQMEQNNLIYSGWKYTCVPYSAILKQRYSTAVIEIMKHYEV